MAQISEKIEILNYTFKTAFPILNSGEADLATVATLTG